MRGEHFGPKVAVPDDADDQTKLIAFTGRTSLAQPVGLRLRVEGGEQLVERPSTNAATPSSSSTRGDVVEVDADRRPARPRSSAPPSSPTSAVRATVPWSSNASSVASGIVFTVSGPISVST